MAIKTRKHENLTETNIQHVMELLNADSPITKKEACSILNISYNTTRLNKIIEDHLETVAYRERRKSQNKGKSATEMEIKQVVNFYLDGSEVSDIAKGLYFFTISSISFTTYSAENHLTLSQNLVEAQKAHL